MGVGPHGPGVYRSVPGFATTLYRANVGVGSVATAETVISTPADQTSAVSETESDLNFMDTGGGGHFSTRQPVEKAFPGMTVGEGLSNYVLQATGTLTITSGPGRILHVRRQQRRRVQPDDHRRRLHHAYECDQRHRHQHDGLRQPAGSGRHPGHHVPGRGQLSGQPGLLSGRGRRRSMEFYAAKESSSAGATSFDANSILVGDATATTASGGTSTTTTPLAVTSAPFTAEATFAVGRRHRRRTSSRP